MKNNIYAALYLSCCLFPFLYGCEENKHQSTSHINSTASGRAIANTSTWESPTLVSVERSTNMSSTLLDILFGIYLETDNIGNALMYWESVSSGQHFKSFDSSLNQSELSEISIPSNPNNRVDHFRISSITSNAFINWSYGDKYLVSFFTPEAGWGNPVRMDENISLSSPVRTQTQRTWIKSSDELSMMWITQLENKERKLNVRKIQSNGITTSLQSLKLPNVDYYVELVTPNIVERSNGDIVVVWKEVTRDSDIYSSKPIKYNLNYAIFPDSPDTTPTVELPVMTSQITGSGDITLTIDLITDKIMLLYVDNNAYYYRELEPDSQSWTNAEFVTHDQSPNFYEAKVAVNSNGNVVIINRELRKSNVSISEYANKLYLYDSRSGWTALPNLEGNYHIEDAAINNNLDVIVTWRDIPINGKSLFSAYYSNSSGWGSPSLVTTVDRSSELVNISNIQLNDSNVASLAWATRAVTVSGEGEYSFYFSRSQ